MATDRTTGLSPTAMAISAPCPRATARTTSPIRPIDSPNLWVCIFEFGRYSILYVRNLAYISAFVKFATKQRDLRISRSVILKNKEKKKSRRISIRARPNGSTMACNQTAQKRKKKIEQAPSVGNGRHFYFIFFFLLPLQLRPTLMSSGGNGGGVNSGIGGGRRLQPPVPPVPPPQAVTSLHSSNDSGFSNEPPVQPDADYSDDDAVRWDFWERRHSNFTCEAQARENL